MGIIQWCIPRLQILGRGKVIKTYQPDTVNRGEDPSGTWGNNFLMLQHQLCSCTHGGGGLREHSLIPPPLRSWRILYFWKCNCAIWWILLGTNLERMSSKKALVFGPDWPKVYILGDILDKTVLKSLKISRFIKSKSIDFGWTFVKVSPKSLTRGVIIHKPSSLVKYWRLYIRHPPGSTPKTVLQAYSEWRLMGGVHTANCVGQNLSTFSQRWFKYHQSLTVWSIWPNDGQNLTKYWAVINLPNNSSKSVSWAKFLQHWLNVAQ